MINISILIATSVPWRLQNKGQEFDEITLNNAMIEKMLDYIPHVLPTETAALSLGQS